jgi:hypothetical protein
MNMLSSVSYFLHGLEIKVAEFVDVLGLIAEDFSSEIVQDVREALGNWILLKVLARHFLMKT